MTGSKVRIWKQDPTVKSIGLRSAYIPTPIDPGPGDSDIVIQGMPVVHPNANNDYLFDPGQNPIEFDAVHTYSVVRQVLTMYRRAFNRNGITRNFDWQWGSDPLEVFPRAGIDANAYYDRNNQSLRFFYFHPSANENLPLVYTCRSFDIVSHEVGHAVLDSLKPGYWNSWHPQTGGLHEAFGDLTTIFMMLAQLDQCEAIIVESKGDLHAKSFFPAVAEQFGEALGRGGGLRNADNDLTLADVSNQVHDISRVFTGAVYDLLADIFEDYHKPDQYDQAETLFRVGKHVTALVLLSIFQGPDHNATFSDIANKMIEIEPVEKWKEFILDEFTRRKVLGPQLSLAEEPPQDLIWKGCCGSMRHGAHVEEVSQSIDAARSSKR